MSSCTAFPDLDEARQIVARLLGAVRSGSYLTISHAASFMVLSRSLTVAKTS